MKTETYPLEEVFSKYTKDKTCLYEYGRRIKEQISFNARMEQFFLDNLKSSEFFIELIKVLKKTKIYGIESNMGVLFVQIEGEAEIFTDNDLKSIWIVEDEDSDDEPTELLYQKELDAFDFLATIWDNDDMLSKVYPSQFEDAVNQALNS